MRRVLLGYALVVGLLLGSATVAVAEVTIIQDKTTGVQDCKGGIAKVMSNKNTLTLKNCRSVESWGNRNVLTIDKTGKLDVMGNQNTMQVGEVESIDVKGNKNTVSYKSGPKGKKPRISNLGNGNTIAQK
jgi:hypothetical protein